MELSLEELTELFYSVREQRNKLLWACQKALRAFDTANVEGKSTWSGHDIDAMRAAVAVCEIPDTPELSGNDVADESHGLGCPQKS